MGYIITATVRTDEEVNMGGNTVAVKARVLSSRGNETVFDIRGEFGREKELTRGLCNALIDAGFVSFKIGHSY